MLSIQYFASIREAMGTEGEQFELPRDVNTVGELMLCLSDSNPRFHSLLASQDKLLVAVNQTVVDQTYSLAGEEEVAFFPPMTGG